jgi:hypothetical protein
VAWRTAIGKMHARVAQITHITTDSADLQVQCFGDLLFRPALSPKADEHGVSL